MDFRTGKPVNTVPDWTAHVTSSANHYENPGQIPVFFVSKAIIIVIIAHRSLDID